MEASKSGSRRIIEKFGSGTIWHRGQFGTADNLAPRTILHYNVTIFIVEMNLTKYDCAQQTGIVSGSWWAQGRRPQFGPDTCVGDDIWLQ